MSVIQQAFASMMDEELQSIVSGAFRLGPETKTYQDAYYRQNTGGASAEIAHRLREKWETEK